MMMNKRLIASAIGLALAAPAGIALAQQSDTQQQTGMGQQTGTQQQSGIQQQRAPSGAQSEQTQQKFQQADVDRDGYLSVDEARQAALPELGPQEFQRADADNDTRLSQQEFQTVIRPGGQQYQSQAPQKGAAGEHQITVQQEPAQIDVQQQPPQVIVKQHQPDVIVKQPQPTVQITQPEPQVQIEQAQPQVQVQVQGKPQVEFQQTGKASVDVVQTEGREQKRQQQQAPLQQQELTQEIDIETGGLWSMSAGDLEGRQVVNAQGEELGDVERVARGSDNKIYAIVSMGGFLGIGDRDVPIPLSDLTLQDDQLMLSSTQSEEQLQQQASDQNMARLQDLEANESLAEHAGGTTGGTQMSFQKLDRDGDGYVSSEEATVNEKLANQWRQVDQNNDGQLDQSEFSAFETERP